jgi:hypothetical protein
MTTRLAKPVKRVVVSARRDQYTVILAPEGIYLREPRRRTAEGPLDYGRLYLMAVKARVDVERATKRTTNPKRA